MDNSYRLDKDQFDRLLNWLSPDLALAGSEYEQIRAGLERYFRFRGCPDPLALADKTISRVTAKLDRMEIAPDVSKINVFYGFAVNIYHEFLAGSGNREIQLDPDLLADQISPPESEPEVNPALVCLRHCLSALKPEEKQLVLQYYRGQGAERKKLRRELAEELGITMNNLHVRVYRIKSTLKKCVEKCRQRNQR